MNTDITPHIWIARVPGLAGILGRLGKITRERQEQHHRGVFGKLRYLDVTRRFPYPDDTFAAVFSSHMLEHLYADEARFCIREIFRVLKPGGICRIAVPDLDKLVSSYRVDAPEDFLKGIFEFSDRKAQKNVHHWHYNEKSLVSILQAVGFSRAYRSKYREGCCPDVVKLDNRPESLFVEAEK